MSILETQINAVTVFPDRARVMRAGTLTLSAGEQTIIITDLPHTLEESSVRVSGTGPARLGGLQLVRRFLEATTLNEAQAAQEKLQALLDQDKIYADEAAAWETRLSVIKNIGEQGGENFARSLARGKMSLEGLTNTLDYLSNSYEAASNALRDLETRRRELQKQIVAAKQEAEKYSRAARRQVYDAHIPLNVSSDGPVTLEITYVARGASWDAVYDARLDGTRVEWNYLAQIKQHTGEDWRTPYALTLSTATLATGIDKPELPPWRVFRWEPPQPRRMKTRAAMERDEDALFDMAPPAAMASPAPQMAEMEMERMSMSYDTAQVESDGPSVTYKIAAAREIPSDDEPHQVNITTLHFDATLDYFCAPKADEHAFVRAKFKNSSEFLMLPGEVSLYHAQDFVGTRETETVAPNEQVELFLGAEPRLRVERKETQREVNKAGLMGSNAGARFAYRITIDNPSLDAARVTVLDQIPVAQDRSIKVELREASPKPSEQNAQGELTWNLEIKKGDKPAIDFGFTVEYPKDLRIVGL